LISKTGYVTLGTGIGAVAISNEWFVLNNEVIIAASFVAFIGYLSTLVRKPYTEWADGQIEVSWSIRIEEV
jgi:F-type H+-transporting ATPase subunit b